VNSALIRRESHGVQPPQLAASGDRRRPEQRNPGANAAPAESNLKPVTGGNACFGRDLRSQRTRIAIPQLSPRRVQSQVNFPGSHRAGDRMGKMTV